MSTTDYYNNNADDFYINTYDVDMQEIYDKFEKHLTSKPRILDAGCGSGRDSKYFLSQGYNVAAMDASEEMVKRARKLTGLDVKQQLFQDIEFNNELDAIWSCASLLHVPKDDMDEVFKKFIKALKPNAIWYMSFKYGETERIKDDRFFNDYTEKSLKLLLDSYSELEVLESWLTDDRREDRSDKWVNIIVCKRNFKRA